MAPLPHNNTGIFYLDYSAEGFDHTMEIRFGASSSALEAAGVADAFLSAVSGQLFLHTIIGARVQDIGTNVSYPVEWDGDATYGSGTEGAYATAIYMSFVGRSLDGRRCRIYLLGAKNVADPGDHNYRYDTTASWVAGGLAALEALPACPVSISGDVVNWKQYANVGINAYWRNKIR